MSRNTNIKFRRGTASEWNSANPILASGEPGYETNTGRFKIGDGVSSWSGLYYTSIIPTGFLAGNNINISLGTNGSTATISVSGTVQQSQSLVTNVFNKTNNTIPKFAAVYINGGQGDQPTIQLAIANGESGSSKTYGVTAEAISSMSTGNVIVAGALTGVNTDQFNPTAPTGDVNGVMLWLSPTTSGGITTTKPSAPNHTVFIGNIVRTHQNAGVVEVKIQNGFELQELHNVALNGTSDGQFLYYNGPSGLWQANTNIYSSGSSIGIGTSSPTTKLQVNGTFSCGGGAVDQGLYVDPTMPLLRFNDSGPNYVADIDINGLTLYNSASGPFFYTDRNNSRIGIGTSTPSTTLDVNGVFKSLGFTSYGGISWFGASDGSVGIAVNTNPSGTFGANSAFAAFQGFNDAVTSYNPICFTTQNDAQVYLNTDGNVGIGTAAPSAKLDINGTVNVSTSFKINSETADTIASFNSSKEIVSLSTSTYPSLTELSYVKGLTSSVQTQLNNKQALLTNPVTGTGVANHVAYWNSISGIVADSGQLYWDATNNRLGIGITAPSGQLHVVGDTYIDNSSKCYLVASGYSKTMNYIWSASNGNLQILGGGPHLLLSSQGGYVDLGGGASTYINIGQNYNAGTNAQNIRFTPAGTERIRITASGSLGIGTTTPSGFFDIKGDMYVRSSGAAGGTGKIYFPANNYGSDNSLWIGLDNNQNFNLSIGGNSLQMSPNGGNTTLNAFSTNLTIGHSYNAGTAAQHIKITPGGTELIRITNSGTMGIGTTSPVGTSRLTIAGSGTTSASAALNVVDSANSSIFYARNDGNVGIGTNTPSTKLQVNGFISQSANHAVAGLTADQTITTGSDTVIQLTDKDDPNNWWNASTYRFLPTVSGNYFISAQVNWKADTGTGQLNSQLRKNGTTFCLVQNPQVSGVTLTQVLTGIVNLNGSTDYVDLTGYSSATDGSQLVTGTADQAWTKLEAHKIN